VFVVDSVASAVGGTGSGVLWLDSSNSRTNRNRDGCHGDQRRGKGGLDS
jgi:hypothetical protein